MPIIKSAGVLHLVSELKLPLIETAEAGSFDRRDVGVAPQPKTYILGSPDDLKFRSCLTLFAEAASDDSDRMLFKQALDQFYGGQADPRTMEAEDRQCVSWRSKSILRFQP